MSDVRELHPKPAKGKPPLAARIFAWLVVAAVMVPAVLAVVYASVWVSVWLVRAIGGLI